MLGAHEYDDHTVIRAYRPHAAEVVAVIGGVRYPLQHVEAGVFAVAVPFTNLIDYRFEVKYSEDESAFVHSVADAYRFLPTLGEIDLHLFAEGRHERLWEILGAHPRSFTTPDGGPIDNVLGPEMKSTGEVMGLDAQFGTAFAKSQTAAYGSLPVKGRVFVSLANRDKRSAVFPVKRLADLGFEVLATAGTAQVLRRNGVQAQVVRKFSEGPDNCVDQILAGEISMVINTPGSTPGGGGSVRYDGYEIRAASIAAGIACITTVPGAAAAVQGIESLIGGDVQVRSLQELQGAIRGSRA